LRQGVAAVLVGLLILLAGTGCQVAQREVLITTTPPDAAIVIDGVERGRGRFQAPMMFGGGRTYTVRVSRLGFTDQSFVLDGTPEKDVNYVNLKPRLRQVKLQVNPPLPAVLRIDGRAVSNEPRLEWTQTLEFTVDREDRWTTHVATVERAGYQPAEVILRFDDPQSTYTLTLEPVKKDVRIVTDPPGAVVYIDGERVGISPVRRDDFVLGIDPLTNEWRRYRVRAEKPNYEPAEAVLSWDSPAELTLRLPPTAVTIRPSVPEVGPDPVRPDPPATNPATRPATPTSGPTTPALPPATLPATRPLPIGPLPTPPATTRAVQPSVPAPPPPTRPVTVNPPATQATTQPRPASQPTPVAPPSTKAVVPTNPPADSVVASVPVLRVRWVWRQQGGWIPEAESRDLATPRGVDEPDGRSVVLIARADEGDVIDQLATSPDGKSIAYAALTNAIDGLHARLIVRPSDPAARPGERPPQPVQISNGRADLMPAFAPGGARVLFVADRAENDRPALRQVALAGNAPAEPAVGGAAPARTLDLWPTLDSSPRQRLFVESRTVGDPRGPRITAIDPTTGQRTDLGEVGVQPRISPRADAVVFVRADPRTGKRDLYILRDLTGQGGGKAVNLTNSPDEDDFDPAWSKDGSRIAWASDRPVRAPAGGAAGAGIGDTNIWVMDVATPDAAMPLTASPAGDDNPAWSGDDEAVYFRSNRGGVWAVWRTPAAAK
jgi:hypothetical protein